MEIGVGILVVGVLIVAIWIIYGFKKVKHKFLTLFLVMLILFSFLSFSVVFSNGNLSFNSVADLKNAFVIYFSWLGNFFNNIKVISTQAIKLDWNLNQTA
jgi:ABC-type multidrug transport system permease subunit